MEQKIPTRNFELRVGILVVCGFLSLLGLTVRLVYTQSIPTRNCMDSMWVI